MKTQKILALLAATGFIWIVCFQNNLSAQLQEKPSEVEQPKCECETPETSAFSIVEANYKIPDVRLVASDGVGTDAARELDLEGPVLMQFAFTSCSTICPILSSTTAKVQQDLGDDADKIKMVTISIDPRHDNPKVLREYAKSLRAGAQWKFFTGKTNDIAQIQKAFDAFTPNKSRHEALTFIRAGKGQPWTRITGLISASDLTSEVRKVLSAQKSDDAKGDEKQGRAIYEQGVLSNGELLEATVNKDVVIRGKMAGCAQCHRKSGFGSDEPGKVVPPITGGRLFSARVHDRGEEIRGLFQEPQTNVESTLVRIPKSRRAYSRESLLDSLRSGFDCEGREFNSLKPRYEFGEEDGLNLIAYLESLGASHPIGVDDDTIHFATIVTDDVSEEEKAAFLNVVNSFIKTKNRETVRYQSRPGTSPNYKNDLLKSYRTWKLHVWELSGSQSMYPLQLATHYENTPVFAVLGGLSKGDWQTVHRFCEFRDLPCIFPQTPMPFQDCDGGSTLYFDRGIVAEAQSLSHWLTTQGSLNNKNGPAEIRVVCRNRNLGRQFVGEFKNQPSTENVKIQQITLPPPGGLLSAVAGTLTDLKKSDSPLVLLLDDDDLNLLADNVKFDSDTPLFLSSSMIDVGRSLQAASRFKARVLLPYTRPDYEMPRSFRLKAWFKARGIKMTHPTMQLKTYFMLSVTAHSLVHMVERHSREYLIERIEHETENALNPGIYSALSLGAGQRFAAGSEGEICSWQSLIQAKN